MDGSRRDKDIPQLERSYDLSEDDKKDYTKIRDKFKAHFEPKSNFRVERHLFRQYAQGANEMMISLLG